MSEHLERELAEAKRKLTESERRWEGIVRLACGQLRRALEATKMGAWSWQPASDGLVWSDELSTLLGLEDLASPLGHEDWLAMVHPDDHERVVSLIERAQAREPQLEARLRIIDPEQGVRHLRVEGALQFDASRQPEYVGVVQDVSAQVRAEDNNLRLRQQLEQTQRIEAIGRLAGGVAHDINNLLTGINLYAALVRDDLQLPASLRSQLDAILDLCARGSGLTTNLLGFARGGKYVPESVDVRRLIEDTTDLLRCSVAKTIQIHAELEPDLPMCWGDCSQLHQVVMNLGLNAVDALGGEGRLRLRAAATRVAGDAAEALALTPGDYVRLDVTDDGCGMDEATRERVFEPFFTTKGEKGTGLGLSMVHGTVHNHGGTIEIDTEVGRGTTISVWLPVARGLTEAPAIPVATAAGTTTGTTRRRQILLVDDEEAIRAAAAEALQQLGYEVVAACDGDDALARFREHDDAFALVILDLSMPRMDGGATFHALRELSPMLPVLLVSGHSEQDGASSLLDAGAAGFLQKPFGRHVLARAIEGALAGAVALDSR